MPKVSVIVPVYKVEPYLRKCVDSILGQTYRDFELILVDDGSPDKCGAICDKYASADPRVHVIHQANGGLSAARNAALDWVFANSSSDYVVFVDSDDWVSDNYLEEMLSEASRGYRIVCVNIDVVTEDGASNVNSWEKISWCQASAEEYWTHLGKWSTTAWGKLFERDFYKDMRFPVGKIHEDEFTTYRAVFSVPLLAYSTAPLYHYLRRKGSITGSEWTVRELDFIEAVREQIEFFKRIGAHEAEKFSVWRLTGIYSDAILKGRRTELRKSLRRLLTDYRMPVLKNKTLYRIASPIRMKWQWPMLRLADVIKRRGVLGALRQWSLRFRYNAEKA